MLSLLRKEKFYLFGMGGRKKMIFKNHCLFALEDQRAIACFDEALPVEIVPDAYRVSGQENCRKILDICKRIHLPVLLSSDSHGRKNVGNMEYIFPLLDEYNFPEELIINHRPDFLWKILDM